MSRSICIIAGTIWGNRGAEAMLATTIGVLREKFPDATFSVLSYYPKKDKLICQDSKVCILNAKPLYLVFCIIPWSIFARWIPKKFVSSRMPPPEVRAISNADLFLDIGGITFNDDRLLFLLYNVSTLIPALILKTPIVKMSQAVGPFKKWANRTAAYFILSRCKWIFARGSITLTHLEDLNLPKVNFSQASDIAFNFKASYSLSHENVDRVEALSKKLQGIRDTAQGKIIAILPSSVQRKNDPTYSIRLARTCKHIVANGHKILLLPQASRFGETSSRNNDIVVIKEILSILGEDEHNILSAPFDMATAEIRQLMGYADLCITSRFHAMIASLCLGIPPIVIGWSHKYLEVLEELQITHLNFELDYNEDDLHEAIDKAIEQQIKLKDGIGSNLAKVRALSYSQFDMLAQFLK